MSRKVLHIFCIVAVLLSLASCGRKGRVIPRGTLSDIYSEMFLADQWLKDNKEYRRQADTSFFYEPIFNRYGYTLDDYLASVDHYLKDPEKFSQIIKDAAAKLTEGQNEWKKTMAVISAKRAANKKIKGYKASDFAEDTVLWHILQVPDTLVLDTVRVQYVIEELKKKGKK